MKVRQRRTKLIQNAGTVTDRALRYRAAKNAPPAPKQCGFCGSKRNVEIHHVNGDESESADWNLMWACKSCNQLVGLRLRNSGIGRVVVNAGRRRSSDARQMSLYGNAVKVMRGEFDGDVSAAVSDILSTPADVRSAYTKATWSVRRRKYGPSGRSDSSTFYRDKDRVPF